ncbi:hypothetical protein [Psychroserpens sp. Hel_I_66]|uniref:hypothetical protein n=1 Tax=Psychroserpens sp. Hel_I_66 TaxID=1250004 RepID=UPI0006478ECC|nr:hypothetical protein [Psychroserpens sp. Hel_I_66]
MKANFAPKYIQSIGNSFILWFQSSNTYAVISAEAYRILKIYLQSKSVKEFGESLCIQDHNQKDRYQELYIELTTFLKTSNTEDELLTEEHFDDIKIPDKLISRSYDFGNKKIKLLFGSPKIEQLFHPQLAHCSETSETSEGIIFSIFEVDGYLLLYKDQTCIYSCPVKDYYLLQGRFALELTSVIHNKDSDKWLATFHASTVCNSNEAVMLIGDSGNGKSTLSAILMANGFDLLSDDFTPFYFEDLSVYRYPAAISIKEGAFLPVENNIKGFKSLPTYYNGPKRINIKYVPPSKDFKSSIKKLPCNKIVSVKYSKDCHSTFKKVSEENILRILIPDSWISPKQEHAKQFLNWLSTIEFYELNYSDNDFAIQSLRSLMSD